MAVAMSRYEEGPLGGPWLHGEVDMLRSVPLAFAALGLAVQAAPTDAAEFRIHVDVGHYGGHRYARPSPWDVGFEKAAEGAVTSRV